MKAVKSALPILFIAALIALFYGHGLLPGHLLMPLDLVTQAWPPWQPPNTPFNVHNDLLSDVVNYIYPVKAFVADTIRGGELPLWNPYVALGYPLTYNTQAGMFYPLSILMYLFGPAQSWNAILVIQMLLGGWFMFAYLRQLALRRAAALLGSIVFLFNGMMVVWLEWQVVHAAVIWLPLQLWCIEKIFANTTVHRRRYMVLTGIAIALPWLNGHWNWTIYCAMTVGLYILWHSWSGARRGFWASVGAVGIGIGLAIVQILPALVYLAQSHRGALTWAQSAERGLLAHAVLFFIPDFFGSPVMKNWWGAVEVLNYNEVTLYLGIVPLLLTVIAVVSRQHSHWRFFTVWGGVGLFWTLGTIAYRPMHALPVFDGLFPSRALTVVVFCVAVLSAIGLQNLLENPRRYTKFALFYAIFSSLIVAFFFWRHRATILPLERYHLEGIAIFVAFSIIGVLLCRLSNQRVVIALVFLAVVGDLYLFGHDYNTVSTIDQLYPTTETATFLQAQQAPYRVVTLASGIVYQPNTSIVDRIENVSGYEPGVLARVTNYLDLAEGEPTVRWTRVMMPLLAADSPLLDALNVKYILSVNDLWSAASTPIGDATIVEWQHAPRQTAIVMPDAGLHRVTVPLRGEGLATVRILSADSTYEFAHASAEITAETVVPFDFGAFPSEWGREFVVVVEAAGGIEVGLDSDANPAITPFYLPRPKLAQESGKTRIYENEGAFPRAFVVHDALISADESETLQLLAANQNELREVAILEGAVANKTQLTDAPSTVTWLERELNHLSLRVEMAADGYLILSDTYYAGWRVQVDGESADLLRANSVMRGVFVPEGEHLVEMVFRPNDFLIGAAISVLTLCLCAVIVWRD